MTLMINPPNGSKRLDQVQPLDGPSARLDTILTANGYTEIRRLASRVCALKQFNYTTAIAVGLDETGYLLRYCYEHAIDARVALRKWNGQGHPPGPWIKCKGAGVDLLNPAFC
jgi:hypothetical protein